MKINNTDIEVPLLNNAFNHSKWKNADKVNFLIENICRIEKVIEKYLNAISSDFPQLTDHSIKHSRMLWSYANLIIGPNYSLNPLEAFVLHIAFLIHDSGMCFSILNNKEEIERDAIYLDYIKELGDAKKDDALFYTVREKHGDFAMEIASEKLRDDEFLIEDVDLREEFSVFIGKIAKSHSCNIGYIEREFGSSQYISAKFPVDWSLDAQKLSFILRVSDAAHIDSLRTPKTNKMIATIAGVSKEHWTFQKKLGFPTISIDNLLVYSSNSPFTLQEQNAWWFCYDALKVLDHELKSANEYFEVKNLPSFQAKGVKSITDTLTLGKQYIRTDGWLSINTQIKVSNPIHIASELGGEKLYGNKLLAIREVIQNSVDAVNLYRIQSDQNNNEVGEIKLSLELIEEEYYLIITDNGIGMSQAVMVNELLDFGASFWKSGKFNHIFSGAKTKGFQSIGKYGIGFFSIFMLGKEINVTSWKFGESISEMKTLSFTDGLQSTPILRTPSLDEKKRIVDRGTSVIIKLDIHPNEPNGILELSKFSSRSLFDIVKTFAPAVNVRISVTEIDKSIKVIPPEALFKMGLGDFTDFIHPNTKKSDYQNFLEYLKTLPINPVEIADEEKVYGRIAVLPFFLGLTSAPPPVGIILSKGIKVSLFNDFIGYILSDEIVSIKRDNSKKIIPYHVLKQWALAQIKAIQSQPNLPNYFFPLENLKMAFGCHDDSLIILLSKKDNQYFRISIAEFKEAISSLNEFSLYQEGHSTSARNPTCDGFIEIGRKVNFRQLVREEEKNMVIEHQQMIENIICDVWGDFKKTETLYMGVDILEQPYLNEKKYYKL